MIIRLAYYKNIIIFFTPMLFFLNILLCAATVSKPLAPGQRITFREVVTPEDQQMALILSNLSKDPHLRYRITTPVSKDDTKKDSEASEEESSTNNSFDSFGNALPTAFNKYYTTPGTYQIVLHNSGRKEIEFQITLYVYKKINDTNKDVTELRNLLNNLQTAMDTLGSENYYLRNRQAKNIKEVKFISKSMNWLVFFPLMTLLIGYLKYLFCRQMVKPKGKRFKGLF